jgi:hypothetical protein
MKGQIGTAKIGTGPAVAGRSRIRRSVSRQSHPPLRGVPIKSTRHGGSGLRDEFGWISKSDWLWS